MGMGTGKSLVAILVLLSLKARRTMIVCPLRVVQVWVAQLERHCGVPILVAALDEDAGSVAKKQELALEKMRLAEVRGVPFVLVLNYDSAWRDPFAEWAEKLRWDLLILDEAHRIKAPGGKASLFFKRLRKMAIYRIALSGTPMPHGPMDIFGIFRAIDILIFGPSFSAFRQKYAVMGGYQRKQIVEFQRLDELERLMSRVTFRVGKEVLDLPPETDVTYRCELGAEARRVYDDLEEDFVALVRDGVVTAANAMVKILRLQQVCGGIAKTDAGVEHRIDDAKQKLLADTLEDIGPGEPVVVFCWFHLDLDAVHEAARSQDFTSMELSGRRDELKQWQQGAAQVLAVQIQAGGEGVDFTRARYSIFYSVGYSLGKYEQARARTHRPGQTNPVEHIHLIARNTVDVKIMRALAKRAEVVESILAEIKN
jgi:SNF2 family DNA or RNA helicase